MQGFVKTSGVAPKQILFCTDPQVSVGVIVDDAGVTAGSDGAKVVKAGTPLYGSITDRDTPVKVSSSSISASATATVTGTGVTAVTVTAATFSTGVSGVSGTYVFTYDGSASKWVYGSTAIDSISTTYGITVTGTPADGDKITVVFTAAYTTTPIGVLLHDVDVTAGDDNGTCLIFGFVDLNKVDESVISALVAAQAALDGKVYLCK